MQRKDFASLIRFSRVLSLSLLVVMLGGLLKPGRFQRRWQARSGGGDQPQMNTDKHR